MWQPGKSGFPGDSVVGVRQGKAGEVVWEVKELRLAAIEQLWPEFDGFGRRSELVSMEMKGSSVGKKRKVTGGKRA